LGKLQRKASTTHCSLPGDVDRDGYLDLAVGMDGGQNVVYINLTPHRIYLPIVFKN